MTDASASADRDAAIGGVTAAGTRSVAAASINAPVITGDHARMVTLAPGTLRAPDGVGAPTGGAWNLPRRPSALFVGRDQALSAISGLFTASSGGSRAMVGQAVAGLGGVGKSELALQYAATRVGAGAVVWWVNAETREQLELGFADLTFRLDPATATAWTTTEAADWAQSWLQAHNGWLVVLDNVEDPRLIEPVLGRLSTGDVLITTRRDIGWKAKGVTVIRLGLLDRAASVEL